jgi:hypothetical protein
MRIIPGVSFLKSIIQEQSDKEAAIQAGEDNPNDVQGGEEKFEWG